MTSPERRHDPTPNVVAIIDAVVRRQDDLREAQNKRLSEMVALVAEHAKELRTAEAARIDAIRAVDVGAVNRATEVAATQASTLAAQVATSAETLRTQVSAAAQAATVALAAALEPIQKDIADLRRVQYEAAGSKAQTVEGRSSWGLVIAAVGLAAAVILGITGVAITLLLR